VTSEVCYLHRTRPAPAHCDLCDRPICARCTDVSAMSVTCPACVHDARRGDRWRRVVRWAIGALALAAAGAGVVALLRASDSRRAERVRALIDEGGHAMAEEAWQTAADAYAHALVLAPDSPDVHAGRGLLFYAQGDDGAARRSLEKARLLGSRDPTVALALEHLDADAREIRDAMDRAGHRAEIAGAEAARRRAEADAAAAEVRRERARALVAEAAADREAAEGRLDEVRRARERQEAQARARDAPLGPCEIRLRRGPSAVLIDAVVNGVAAAFTLDTGATHTAVTEGLVTRAHLPVDREHAVRVHTANGVRQAPVGVIETIAVGGRTVDDLRITVCPTCADLGTDGLLGLDVQNALGMAIDLPGLRVRFGDCR
jgi:predicted aspartyl protease